MTRTLVLIIAFAATWLEASASGLAKQNASSIPSQAVVSILGLHNLHDLFNCVPQLVDKLSFAVMGNNGSFRQSAFTQLFNPTNASPPFFQVFDSEFLTILGDSPSIRIIASDPDFAFAHEAPIWLPETDEVTFASNDGGALGMSGINQTNQVSKISLKDVEVAIQTSGSTTSPVNVNFTKVRKTEQLDLNAFVTVPSVAGSPCLHPNDQRRNRSLQRPACAG